MRTSVLGRFFAGQATTTDLRMDLVDARFATGRDTVHHRIEDDLVQPVTVTAANLIALRDAVIAGELSPEDLETLAFAMIASDGLFIWDDDSERGWVEETIHDWAVPEANYALRPETVEKFRSRLMTGENTLADGS
jgi:hypothetical protein